jgi:hypothetical protein
MHETRKVDNDYPMEELEIAPDKLAVEDKYPLSYRRIENWY